jgi:hypothetical protein
MVVVVAIMGILPLLAMLFVRVVLEGTTMVVVVEEVVAVDHHRQEALEFLARFVAKGTMMHSNAGITLISPIKLRIQSSKQLQ